MLLVNISSPPNTELTLQLYVRVGGVEPVKLTIPKFWTSVSVKLAASK